MTDAAAAAWAHVILQTFEILGGLGGAIGGMAVLLARRTFATRDDLARAIADHAKEHQEFDERLAKGEIRFAEMTGAIELVSVAAKQAMLAADRASDAADRIQSVNVEVAAVRGDIKALEAKLQPLERLTLGMVEGHMADARATPRRPRP